MPEPRITPAAKGIFLGEVDAGIVHGVDAGHHGKLREAVDPLGFVRREYSPVDQS